LAVAVLDAFHVVRLGTQVVDEVRRRVQQDTLHRRGHKEDPLYKIRGLLHHSAEHLTDKQQAKITACLDACDPNGEVNRAWQYYQHLRSIYHASPQKGRTICQKILESVPYCRSPRSPAWAAPSRRGANRSSPTSTPPASNGGTEAIKLIVEEVRRLAHGLRDFEHYGLRILLAASGQRRYPERPKPCLIPENRKSEHRRVAAQRRRSP
jgi:transposase